MEAKNDFAGLNMQTVLPVRCQFCTNFTVFTYCILENKTHSN